MSVQDSKVSFKIKIRCIYLNVFTVNNLLIGFYPKECPKFGKYFDDSSFTIVEDVEEEFQIELELKNPGSHNGTIDVNCIVGESYQFNELFFAIKLFFKEPISNWERLVFNGIT